MTLIERLRRRFDPVDSDALEAADEIERLRKQLADAGWYNSPAEDQIAEKDAEIERLQADKAALTFQVDHTIANLARNEAEVERLREEVGKAQYERLEDCEAEIARLHTERDVLLDRIDEHHKMFEPMRVEIERLRRDLDYTTTERETYNGYHQAACLEIKRLQRALARIAGGSKRHDNKHRDLMYIAAEALRCHPQGVENPSKPTP